MSAIFQICQNVNGKIHLQSVSTDISSVYLWQLKTMVDIIKKVTSKWIQHRMLLCKSMKCSWKFLIGQIQAINIYFYTQEPLLLAWIECNPNMDK